MTKKIEIDPELFNWLYKMAYERVELFHASYKGFRQSEHDEMDRELAKVKHALQTSDPKLG